MVSQKKEKEKRRYQAHVLMYIIIIIIIIVIVGPKDLATSAHFISSPRPMPRRKKCPRKNKENPDYQDILSRMTLSSANWDHGRGKCHATNGGLFEHPNGKHKRSGPAIGAWWRSNSRRGCHLRIKYPQLTSWPYLCGRDPWTVLSGSPQLTECQREWLMGRALNYGHGWLTSVRPGWS